MQTSDVDGWKQNNTNTENKEDVNLKQQPNTTHANQLNQPTGTLEVEQQKQINSEPNQREGKYNVVV